MPLLAGPAVRRPSSALSGTFSPQGRRRQVAAYELVLMSRKRTPSPRYHGERVGVRGNFWICLCLSSVVLSPDSDRESVGLEFCLELCVLCAALRFYSPKHPRDMFTSADHGPVLSVSICVHLWLNSCLFSRFIRGEFLYISVTVFCRGDRSKSSAHPIKKRPAE